MNQILISQRIYVTREMKRKRMMYKTLYIISIATIIVLLVYYVIAEKNRDKQELVGKEILSKIDDDTTTVSEDAIVISLDNQNESQDENVEENVTLENVEEQETQSNPKQSTETSKATSTVKASNGNYYDAEAVFTYPKLGISYPVLSEQSDALLKISLCKYWGPSPNEVGNYCIVGHNYRSGKMFGKLSMAAIGDEVELKDLSGRTVTYTVYDRYVVEPTDVSCTSQLTNGNRELTLITCTNFGKQRLVVKARES